jgi:hypothetical protein
MDGGDTNALHSISIARGGGDCDKIAFSYTKGTLLRFSTLMDVVGLRFSPLSALVSCSPREELGETLTDVTDVPAPAKSGALKLLTRNPSGDDEPGRDVKGDAAPALLKQSQISFEMNSNNNVDAQKTCCRPGHQQKSELRAKRSAARPTEL